MEKRIKGRYTYIDIAKFVPGTIQMFIILPTGFGFLSRKII